MTTSVRRRACLRTYVPYRTWFTDTTTCHGQGNLRDLRVAVQPRIGHGAAASAMPPGGVRTPTLPAKTAATTKPTEINGVRTYVRTCVCSDVRAYVRTYARVVYFPCPPGHLPSTRASPTPLPAPPHLAENLLDWTERAVGPRQVSPKASPPAARLPPQRHPTASPKTGLDPPPATLESDGPCVRTYIRSTVGTCRKVSVNINAEHKHRL